MSAPEAVENSVTDVGEPMLVRVPVTDVAPGDVLAGRYQIEAVIGRGGSGVVLRSFDRLVQVPVAIKILRQDLAQDPRWVGRFSRELRLGRQIQHPHVCRVFDIGEADGNRFLTMELATAGTVRDTIEACSKRGRPLADRIADARAVISGLAAFHAVGIVHRDVKPENLLRMEDGRLVLSDFGLATNPAESPATTIMVGTPSYMAPEIVMGEPASARSDLWAAGITIHEIVFGVRPRAASTPGSTPASGTTGVEAALYQFCLSLIADDPVQRPSNAGAAARLFEAAVTRPLRFSTSRRLRKTRRLLVASVPLLVVLLVGLGFRHRLWSPAGATSIAHKVASVTVSGVGRDWTNTSKLLAAFPGQVHCVAALPTGRQVRVVWGDPRRAEDIELSNGQRHTPRLDKRLFETGCPQLSPKGESVLFTRSMGGTSPQIVLTSSDGVGDRVLISGTEPEWLPNGEEFVFNLDSSHAALFTVPTMSFSLLSEGEADPARHLYAKTLSPGGQEVAVIYDDGGGNRLLVVQSLPGLGVLARWRLPRSMSDPSFSGSFLQFSEFAERSALTRLSWTSGAMVRLGSVGRAKLTALPGDGVSTTVLARNRDTDIWIFDGPHLEGRPLTHDGQSYAAAWSPRGDVLVQKRVEGGQIRLYRYARDGRSEPVTQGPLDGSPSFAAGGTRWFYTDYPRREIRACDAAGCRTLTRDPLLPVWPVVAPDDRRLAFVTEIGSPRLHVYDLATGGVRDLGPTAPECPPVWTTSERLWAFSGSGSKRAWVEIDLANGGGKTGRSKVAVGFDPDRSACGSEAEAADSPFFRRVRPVVRETAELRQVSTLD